MQNLPAIVTKRKEIVRRMSLDLSTTPTESEALHIIGVLLASWPQKGHEDEKSTRIYVRQLTELLMGYPLTVCKELVSPKVGIVGNGSYFLPSVAEVKKFCDDLVDRREERLHSERQALKQEQDRHDDIQLTPEDRAHRMTMLRDLSKVIKDTANAKRMELIPPVQLADGPAAYDMRMAALKNLQILNGKGVDPATEQDGDEHGSDGISNDDLCGSDPCNCGADHDATV